MELMIRRYASLFFGIFLFPGFFSVITTAHADASYRSGGLIAYPVPVVGENLLTNSGFEIVDTRTGSPAGWSVTKSFSADAGARSGRFGLMLKDAPAFPYTESATQEVHLKKGSYRFGGWMRSELEDSKNKGVRFSVIGAGSTKILSGSCDWKALETNKIFIPKDGTYKFKIEVYSKPSGRAWFDDVYLKRESLPVEAFLLYPNYRGMLFDDQTQAARLAVNVDPPQGKSFSSYSVIFSVVDETTGTEISANRTPAKASFEMKIDCTQLVTGRPYLLHTRLVQSSNNAVAFEYPAYRIVKLSGKLRKKMSVSFDEYNRFLVSGVPTFWLGVYDSGMGYPASEGQWQENLTKERRLFELPINLYLNYWYGQASLKAIQTLMNTLQKHGIYYLQTGNAFDTSYNPKYFAIDKEAEYLMSISKHPGLAGFYTVDEAVSSLAPTMFGQYQRLREAKADGMTFGAFLKPDELRYWRDTVDVISMDPYPLAGSEPNTGYPLAQVANWTRATQEAVMNSRPFMAVLQYFKQTYKSRWPTRDELRNMSYMAITEGANGLMYWSMGAKGLSDVCKGWCVEKVQHFEDLKTMITELKGIEDALASVDRPDLLSVNSYPSEIRTRVKFVNGRGYLIAYNYSSTPISAKFTWFVSPKKVLVYNENRKVGISGSDFSDKFGPFQAHVYEIYSEK